MAVISFARGVPSPDILPVEELADCAREVLERDGRTILNYGPAFGYVPLREWLAERHGVQVAQVLVTTGSLQGFNFLARHLFRDGGRAVIEAPSYDRPIVVLREVGATIESVPLTGAGLDLDALEAILAAGETPRLVYTIPTFQNPSGRTLSLDQRRRLVELAHERRALLLEDDPYGLVRYDGEPLPSLYELAGREGVIFSSSFSKTVAPGLRVGYFVLPPELVKPIEAVASSTYISPSLLPQAALFELIRRGGFEPNLARTRELLRARRDAMLAALDADFPEGSSWNRPEGGYFLWLDFPAGVDAAALLARGQEAGVVFVKGSDFYAGPGGESSGRLAFSYPAVDEIPEGIRRLAALVREAAAVPAL